MDSGKKLSDRRFSKPFWCLIQASMLTAGLTAAESVLAEDAVSLQNMDATSITAKEGDAEANLDSPPIQGLDTVDVEPLPSEKMEEEIPRKIAQSIEIPDTTAPAPPLFPPPYYPKPGDLLDVPSDRTNLDPLNPDRVFMIRRFDTRAKRSENGESQTYNEDIFRSVAQKVAIVVEDGAVKKIVACTEQRRKFEKECKKSIDTLFSINDRLADRQLTFTFSQLFQITQGISEVYLEMGYRTSGAIVSLNENADQTKPQVATLEVVEGYLKPESINVTVTPAQPSTNVRPEYISSQIATRLGKPLNITKLQESLQLLAIDPLIAGVDARLAVGTKPGESILNVNVQEARFSKVALDFNNSRSPIVGEIERRATLRLPNLLGLGDQGTLSFANTEGSNAVDFSYTLPLNPWQDTLRIAYGQGNSEVIEEPFRDINRDGQGGDIRSSSRSFDITFRHPMIRQIYKDGISNTPDNTTFEEFAIGLTGSWRESSSTLLGIPFPLSAGADSNGSTRVAVLRAFQEYSLRDSDGRAIGVKSQFNFGLGAFGSSISSDASPDSRFASWQLQALLIRELIPGTNFIIRVNSQLALQPLVSSEQFSVGGYYNVRSYRKDTQQTDNGISYSVDVPIAIARLPDNSNIIQIVPFFDAGIGWNTTGDKYPSRGIYALGLGLQWKKGNDLTARIDYGIPLERTRSDGKSFQDNGLYFTVQWNSF
jgi:hemolysin activation/secretion protein